MQSLSPVFLLVLALQLAIAQDNLNFNNFVDTFASCKWDSPDFDACIKNALNTCRAYFKTGIPELSISPFDPFFAKEIVQTRGGSNFNYRLKLINVSEYGWTDSIVTKFKSNRNKRWLQYSQFFPEKWLDGEYEFQGKVMNRNIDNKGAWNLTLYDYIQTTTVSRPSNTGNIKVRIEVQSIGDMKLHVSHLLRGRTFMENVLDRMINASWRPGFAVVRPLVNDMVSTAFTEIFNNNFKDLDLNTILPN
ncbi:uncharacterized protein Jhbp16 [Halyomorpha halys]|uniref:uncharacterized protein Jhbp16 n=1 Tax=Halyomorpha halys TaxID=286706 RepID=UPI0006D4D0D8|nr:uncharacterized protein LOC106677882 [Halyomorpha halys]